MNNVEENKSKGTVIFWRKASKFLFTYLRNEFQELLEILLELSPTQLNLVMLLNSRS